MSTDLSYSLGIDTSNYTTSIAIVDHNYNIVTEKRIQLQVNPGERGIRQSLALFKHIENMPVLAEYAFKQIDTGLIRCVAASSRPRPQAGSYMPVFKGAQSFGRLAAAIINAEYHEFSHQEGHIEAVRFNSPAKMCTSVIALHLSGGTTEVLKAEDLNPGYSIEIIGRTRDISLGQLIDRIGVAMGMRFPAGKEMDEIACTYGFHDKSDLKDIYVKNMEINLSGIETQCLRLIEGGYDQKALICDLFLKISKALCIIIDRAVYAAKIKTVILAGGVSSSRFIRYQIMQYFKGTDITIVFGEEAFSSDNAVGLAVLGMKALRSGACGS